MSDLIMGDPVTLVDGPPGDKQFVVDILPSKPYFPGEDYPDREVWLARRYTSPKLARGRVIGFVHQGGTMSFAANATKRVMDKTLVGRRELLRMRRANYLGFTTNV